MSQQTEAPVAGWIATVDVPEAEGVLAEAYAAQAAKLGHVTELTQIGSLYPELVAARLKLYEVVDATPSGVPEWLRRAVSLLTSALNGCLFCTVGHIERLRADGYGELAEAIEADPAGYRHGVEEVDAILDYARTLVTAPGNVTADEVARIRAAGWSDLDILDVNNLAAYYSYINRVASGLGLQRRA